MASEWEDTNRPLGKGLQRGHEPPENIRKKIWLTTVGKYATADKAARLPHTVGDEATQRFAAAWEDVMTDFPVADLTFSTAGGFPTEEDDNLKLPGIDPGDLICWFDRSFSHPVAGVVKTGTDFEFKFAATSVTKDAIYNDNSTPVDIDGTQETWNVEEDNFRPGTPFTITGAFESANDGFYRVRSVRSDANGVYVIPDDNEYNQQDLIESGSGGNADCDFGGDWYALRGGNGNSLEANNTDGGEMNDYFALLGDLAYEGTVRDRWWTPKDIYHRYEKTGGGVTYGPNDSRPPTGGLASKDFNGDWVRTPNPSRYHTWDENAHRWFVKSETDGSQPPDPGGTYEQFTQLIPASDFLSFQPDPREIRPPFRFADTARTSFKYNEKVKFTDEQITAPSNLGALSAVIRTGWIGSGPVAHGLSSHSQYKTPYSVPRTGGGSRTVLGDTPLVAGQSPKSSWINKKYSNSLQNACEMAISETGWMLEPDNDYKTNWIDLNGAGSILMIDTSGWPAWDSGTTYGDGAEVKVSLQVYVSIQAGNLNHAVSDTNWWRKYTFAEALADFNLDIAWQPTLNPDQPFHALMSDELWSENGSAFELALKTIGRFDWYYDETFPFRSKRNLDDGFEWWNDMTVGQQDANYPLPATYNGFACTTSEDVINAFWRVPVGTWRRTWKYSLGKVQDAAMADGDQADPAFEDYDADIDGFHAQHPDTSIALKMYGHHRMNDPGELTDDAAIAGRHEKTYEINGHKIFTENVRAILSDCRSAVDVLDLINDFIDLVRLIKNLPSDTGATNASFSALVDHLEDYNEANEPALSTYAPPIAAVLVGQRYGYIIDAGDNKLGNNIVENTALKLTKQSGSEIDLGGANGNGRKFQALLSAKCHNDHYDDDGNLFDDFEIGGTGTQTNQTPGVTGLVEIACLTNDDNYYGLAELRTEDADITWNAGTGEYEYIYKLTDRNGFMPRPQNPHTLHTVSDNLAEATISLNFNNQVVVEIDWDLFDGLWDRDWERGDYRLVDSLT